jgi:hypothetical protein
MWTKRGPGRAAQRSGRFGSLGTRASPGLHKDFEAWCEASAHSPLDGVIADLQHERECALAQQQARVGVRRSAPCSGDADAGRTRFTAAVSRMAGGKREGAPPWPAVPAAQSPNPSALTAGAGWRVTDQRRRGQRRAGQRRARPGSRSSRRAETAGPPTIPARAGSYCPGSARR